MWVFMLVFHILYRSYSRHIGFFLVLFGLWTPALMAGQTTWVTHDTYARSRVITASTPDAEGRLLAGWEIELESGWKTYWRSPGEAGLPVTARVNGEPVEILFPLPERFEFYGTETYGYKKQAILPFYLPASIIGSGAVVDISFMVCHDICVPLEVDFQLATKALAEPSPLADIKLARWMDKVPARSGQSDLAVETVRLAGAPGRQRLIIDVAAGTQLNAADLLVESSTGISFARPSFRLIGDGTRARAVIPALMRERTDLAGSSVRVTFANGAGEAIDRSFTLGGF